MKKINDLTIFLVAFGVGFLIGGIKGYRDRNDKDRILNFISENIIPEPASSDWRLTFSKGETWYSYSISKGQIGSNNFTKETDQPIIDDKSIDELYKIAGISSSISVSTIMILKNKSVSKILLEESLALSTKVKRVLAFIGGIISGYLIGYKIVNPNPSMKSQEFVTFLSTKDNWEKIIVKKFWQNWYWDAVKDAYLLEKDKKMTSTEFVNMFRAVQYINKDFVEGNIDYRITVNDFTQLVRTRELMFQKIKSSMGK